MESTDEEGLERRGEVCKTGAVEDEAADQQL